MRKMMATAIVALMAGVSSSWGIVGLEEVSFDGSLEFSGNAAENETDFNDAANDNRGDVETRVRLGVNAMVTENAKGRVEFARVGRKFDGSTPTTIATEEGLWRVQNAYVELNGVLALDKIRLGRQYTGMDGDLVWHFGPKYDDALTITALDGLLVKETLLDEQVAVKVFWGKANEDDGLRGTGTETNAADAAGDTTLANVQVGLMSLVPNAKIWLGWLSGEDENATVSSDDNRLRIYRAGIKGGVLEDFLTYRAEYLLNSGHLNTAAGVERDYAGDAIDLGVGVNFQETGAGTFGVAANFVKASGDDDTTDADDDSFRDFSALGGVGNPSDRYFGEIFGRSNTLGGGTPIGQGLDTGAQGFGLQVIHLGGWFRPAIVEGSSVRLDYYNLTASEDNAAGKDEYGTEIDLTFGYMVADNVDVDFGYAMFSPEEVLAAAGTPDDDVTKFFGRVSLAWGGEAM